MAANLTANATSGIIYHTFSNAISRSPNFYLAIFRTFSIMAPKSPELLLPGIHSESRLSKNLPQPTSYPSLFRPRIKHHLSENDLLINSYSFLFIQVLLLLLLEYSQLSLEIAVMATYHIRDVDNRVEGRLALVTGARYNMHPYDPFNANYSQWRDRFSYCQSSCSRGLRCCTPLQCQSCELLKSTECPILNHVSSIKSRLCLKN